MKKFIKNIFLYSLPIVLFIPICDYYLSNSLNKSNDVAGEFEVWSDIYKGTINSNLAIYGSSRAWVQINPKTLEDSLNLKAYNFGIDGHNFWLQYLRHKEYLKYNTAPKTIVISVDAFSLAKRTDLFRENQFLPYMLWNKNIRKYTASYEGFNDLDYYIPLVRYYGRMQKVKSYINLNYNKDSNYRERGFKSFDKSWNNDLKKAKSKMNYYSIDLDTKSIDLFNTFLLECKKEQIQVILVYAPEHISGQKFIINRQETINLFKGFSNKYKLTFLDYSKNELCSNKEYFYNSMHLNKKGSELFSKTLAHDLKPLMFKSP